MGRTNFTPTARTIIVALLLMLLGLLGTFGDVVSDGVGIIAFLCATGILLVGMVFKAI
jgi:hypothetical protein